MHFLSKTYPYISLKKDCPMRKIVVYIATSMDGFIARKNGSIDWLPTAEGEDYGYKDFLATIDTVLMGNNTYKQILDFDIEYPYKDCANYVFTRNEALIKDENTLFIQESPAEFMKKLKAEEGKDIWLIGGGEIVDIATKEHLADELMLFIMPVIIGDGLPLFLESSSDRKVELISSRSYPTGVVAMHYQFL